MDLADLVNGIQTEIFEKWKSGKDWEQRFAQLDNLDDFIKLIKRCASGRGTTE